MAEQLLSVPEILQPLQTTAPRIIKGGSRVTITLLKYPVFTQELRSQERAILSAWDTWWSETAWVKFSQSEKPRWGSACRTGQIWNNFGEGAVIPSGDPVVFCLNCNRVLQHPTLGNIGTTHLHNHLQTQACRSSISSNHERDSAPPSILPRRRLQATSSSIQQYSTQAFEEELVRVVVDNNWSFRAIERPSFQRFIHFLRPDAVITSRYKFGKIFQDQYSKAAANLLSDLGEGTKLSIALDAWSASNHLSFLAIKGYYINTQWELQEKLLDFIPIRGSHTGRSMAKELLRVLLETNTTQRLLCITCDNASSNSTLTQLIESELRQKGIKWRQSENSIPCLAHIINLVVQDIIQHLKLSSLDDNSDDWVLQGHHVRDITQQISVPNSLRKLRAICIAIDASPQRFERFIATQQHLPPKERLSVIRDVKTRWNSTFDMCERAIKLQSYINDWLKQEIALRAPVHPDSTLNEAEVVFRDFKRLQLGSAEWHHLEILTQILRHFKNATNYLSEKKPQIQHIWLMYNRLFDFLDEMTNNLGDDAENQEDIDWPAVVRDAAEKGRSKLSKYYSKTNHERGYIFNCASILDPTQKLTVYEDDTWDWDDKHIYREQFLNYISRYDNQERRQLNTGSYTRRSQGSEWFRKPSTLQSQSSSFSSSSQNSLTEELDEEKGPTYQEGELYLSAPCVREDEGFNLLDWWRINSLTYPNLAKVAKDILAVPIAQVGVERVFNIAKDTIGERRHRLSAQTIRQIMVLKCAIREELDQTTDTLTQDELPLDEASDLFTLPVDIEEVESVDIQVLGDITEDYLGDQEMAPPARKRLRSARSRD